ncbi:hypothetical protein OCU04_002044 [Sclerotinia nivalis]|uniref:Uncharacterized protein n=1 Tax=Sclerotinia nivalis TaxID=352851 RepID=A0A9X0B0Z9_9HELO|nr:hypothetical protein OCU04_002044 [Sclerotinia nivalis]
MIGCLWEFPSTPRNENGLTCFPNNQTHEKRFIWVSIDQTLPSLTGFSECALRELRMILQQKSGNKRVRVKCLSPFEHRGYELGLDFESPRINFKVRDRLVNMINRALGNLTSNGFDPRYPPKQSGVSWSFRNHYCFPQACFSKWTVSETLQCHRALDNQDLRVELKPDSEWRYRCLRSSIKSKLSCATDLYKTRNLSVNDIEVVFMLGPKTIGWAWRCTSSFSSSKLPNLRYALKGTGKVELNNWKETELEALDKSVEQGWLYLEPINSTSKDSKIRDADIEDGEIVETMPISEVASPIDEVGLRNIEASNNKRANPHKSAIEKLVHEYGNREFPEPRDEPWLRLLQKHGISKADYTDWLKLESCNFERPPTSKDNGISSPTQSSATLPSALSIPSVPLKTAKPGAQVSNENEVMIVRETSVSPTMLQIREQFVNRQSKTFDNVYGQLLDRCILEAKELLEEQHTVQMATLNTKLLEVGQEKVALEDQTLILQDRLEKKSNELDKSKDEIAVKNADTKKYIDSLFHENTTAKKEKESAEAESLAFLENGKTLQRELNESKARRDEMELANSSLVQQMEELTKGKNGAEANSMEWKEKFEAKKYEMDSEFGKWNGAFTEINTRRLELKEEMKTLKDCISKLRAINEAEIASAQKTRERVGREMALQDLKFGQEKEFEAIKRAHLEHIQLVRNTEYCRRLEDGQSTQTNEKRLQSLATNPTMEQKESTPRDQNMDQNMDEQIAVGFAGYRQIAPKRLAHSPMQPAPIQPVPIQSPVASTPVLVSVNHFNFYYELGLLPQSPGPEIIPSKLSVFNHAFLEKVFGGYTNFWNNVNMQLMLEHKPRRRNNNDVCWPRILKIHNDTAPGFDLRQRPSIGKHGALLLIRDLDDKIFVGNEYPTFLNTVQGHAVYIGQYKIIKQIVNDPSVHPLGLEFKDYLLKNQLKIERGRSWSKKQFGNRRPIKNIHSMLTAFEKDCIKTSWTVFEYVGFDLKSYEALLTKYSQIEPFCNRKRGIPLVDADGGFEHTLLNEILNSSSLKKRVHDVEDSSECERKRLKKSHDNGTSKSPSVREIEDDSTIVVDVSPRRLR